MSTFNQFQLFSDLASADGCITSVSRIPNSMEVFWINKDGSVHGAYWYDGSNWGNYELAPAGSASTNGSITAVSRIPNSMEVFWVGQNGSIQDAYWYEGANWQHFELAPAGSASTNGSITAVSRIPNSMEVFWVGQNGSIQDAYWYEGANWQHFELAPAGSASTNGSITAVSRIPNSMEVFWVGQNGSIQDAYWYEGANWQHFELAPAGSASTNGSITAVSRIPNSMEVFWVGQNGSIQDAYWYEGANWQHFELAPAGSASTNGSITAVSRIPNSMEVFWVGQNGSIQDAYWYEGSNWGRYELFPSANASTNGSITVVSRIPNSMELWFIGNNGSVQDGYWYDSNAKLALKRRLSISGSIFVRDDDEGTNSEQDRNILGAIEFDNKLQGVFEFIKKAPNGQIGKIAFVTNLNSDNSISIHREASCTDSDTQTKDITLTVDNEFHEQIHCEHNPTIGARNWADFNINLKNESFLSDKVLDSITLHKNIVTGGIDAFGGWVEVTINRDGNIRFKGHCHDSGFESYNFNIRTIVHSESPIVLAMQKSGHVEGTTHSGIFDAPRRDFDWDETTFNPNITSSFDDIIKNITMDVYSSDSGDISSTLEDIANFAIKWIAGSILINPLTGLIIFVGVEIGSIATGAGFAGGARVISNILWCAGPFGTLYAIAAEGIAKLGENERELTDDEYNFANSNIFIGTLPAKGDVILTDTIGGNNRAFTMPRFDGKITVNMGEDGFRNPLNYQVGWTTNTGEVIQKGQVFIHELTHAWQIKNTHWSLGLMASALASKVCEVGGGDPYNFGTDATKPFGDFNLEQQAHIVDHWFASCVKDINGNIIQDNINNISSPWYHFIEGNIRVGQPS